MPAVRVGDQRRARRGQPDADLVCVGEAPGENEDLQGKPFVGASGQLLTKILAAINLGRDDVFIANVLKHRPPGNRNPRPDEVAACSPYLVRQLELIRPKVILCFGTFAAQTLLNTNTPLGKLRGSVHRYYGTPLVVTYHPAALLRNPKTDKKVKLPPGPNSPVGVMWLSLSKEHLGIHGTAEPSQMSRAESSGCVRLTNWDVVRLSAVAQKGINVEVQA